MRAEISKLDTDPAALLDQLENVRKKLPSTEEPARRVARKAFNNARVGGVLLDRSQHVLPAHHDPCLFTHCTRHATMQGVSLAAHPVHKLVRNELARQCTTVLLLILLCSLTQCVQAFNWFAV